MNNFQCICDTNKEKKPHLIRRKMAEIYDVIVVGAGIEGSATAYHSALNNKTLLLEQFPLPHSRGSSGGHSRIIRKAYIKEHYARMMPTAYRLWEELENEEGIQIIVKTGLVNVGVKTGWEIDKMTEVMTKNNSPHETLDTEQVVRRFPMLNIDSRYKGLYDPEAGVLRADRALQGFQNQFVKRGGTLRDGEPVTSIIPGDAVTVITTKHRYRTKNIILCVGPWTSKLVGPLGLHLPLEVHRVGVYYWKAGTDQFTVENKMPCTIFTEVVTPHVDGHVYTLPVLEYPGHMKLCYHSGKRTDPDHRDAPDAMKGAAQTIEHLKDFVRSHLPGLEPEPSIREACMYTVTPDSDFILDTHPHWKNVVIGAGFSGSGFKLAPVVGKVLTELATKKQPSFDLTPFTIDRFFKMSKM